MPIKLTDVDIVGVASIQIIGPGLSQLELLTKKIEEKHSKVLLLFLKIHDEWMKNRINARWEVYKKVVMVERIIG